MLPLCQIWQCLCSVIIYKMRVMKKILLSTVLLGLVSIGQAQTTPSKKKPAAKSSVKATKTPATTSIVVLYSTSANNAYTPSSIGRLQIADTTINFMNQRAAGANISFGNSAIADMPKGTYGFANGKIFLRNTTATTSGSAYGSGAVGTGTSIHGAGTSESTIGVNGKSPDAGPWLWGDRRPVYTLPRVDSIRGQ